MTNLFNGCKKALKDCNVKEENIFETSVPGSFELPLAARFLALSGTVDAIVCVGVLIKGEVSHSKANFKTRLRRHKNKISHTMTLDSSL